MSRQVKVQTTIYPEKDLLKEVDIHVIKHDYKDRNEFITKAMRSQMLLDEGIHPGQIKLKKE